MSEKKIERNLASGIYLRAKVLPSGNTIIKANIDVIELEKWLKNNARRGQVVMDIKEVIKPKENGPTHYAELNTWKPSDAEDAANAVAKEQKLEKTTKKPETKQEAVDF